MEGDDLALFSVSLSPSLDPVVLLDSAFGRATFAGTKLGFQLCRIVVRLCWDAKPQPSPSQGTISALRVGVLRDRHAPSDFSGLLSRRSRNWVWGTLPLHDCPLDP